MPKLLVQRLKADSIEEFTEAARARLEDGRALVAQGRGLAAIYLWGYSAEMILKAAFFRWAGFSVNQPILIGDIRNAVDLGRATYHIVWPKAGDLHNIGCWGVLLREHRHALGKPLAGKQFLRRMQFHSACVYQYWRETLRYHKNRAYAYEIESVFASAQWLVSQVDHL